jgi:VIT1/CCC1 family predicted Fe2+/Mn2+ transporter
VTHAREELGIDPDQLGSPQGAAVSSFLSFALGALIPLLPWFFGSGTAAVVASVVLGLAACAVVGALLARFTGRSVLFSAGRQVLIATIAGAVTFFVGNLVGVGV